MIIDFWWGVDTKSIRKWNIKRGKLKTERSREKIKHEVGFIRNAPSARGNVSRNFDIFET